ncbi:ATP-binding protein [Nocardioides ultimimeridianus]
MDKTMTGAATMVGVPPAEATTYVGRGAEIADARQQLQSGPLVTLTGPGGVGKTRLALRLCAIVGGDHPDGVLFVPLAEVVSSDLLVSTVADLLDLRDFNGRAVLDVVIDALRDSEMLVVLDNCEHLIEACAQFVEAVIRSCPKVVVLATSRQSLGIPGERIHPVLPLATPEPGERLDSLEKFDAVRLFVERAEAVVPSFALTAENARDVVRVCDQLEGLPLAIELAAIRLRVLSVRQLADRLGEQFAVLSGDSRKIGPNRHGTLRAVIDWSHERCTDAERLLWARASVFVGGFDLDAAEAVCSGDGLPAAEVLDVLDGLLDKSILLRDERSGVVRYQMLETVRQYGEEQLVAADELVPFRRRHRDWFLELARRFQAAWLGPHQVEWSSRLRRDLANLRAALEFCAGDPDEATVGLQLAVHLREYWLAGGLSLESRRHFSRLLDAARPDAKWRTDALWIAAFVAIIHGDRATWQAATEAAASAPPSTDTSPAYVELVRGYEALIGNRMPEAASYFLRADEMFTEEGSDPSGELWARYNYGIATVLAGDLDGGRVVLRRCIAEYAAKGEIFWRSWAVWSLGAAELLAGDLEQAREACQEVFRLERQVRDRLLVAFALTVSAGVAARNGRSVSAARIIGAAAAEWKALGTSPDYYVAFREQMNADTDRVVARIGEAAAHAAFLEGYALTAAEGIAAALEDLADEVPADTGPDDLLTRREMEIACLVATGMTNREIAEHLVISQRTVETHVNHILGKLDFASRTQVAAWIHERSSNASD